MSRTKRMRVSLSLRLQPYSGDPMAEVAEYLNSLSKDEVNRKVADILVAALLPIARYHSGQYTPEQLRFACWEAADSLNKHGSNMRLALGVEQPQFALPQQVMPTASVMVNKLESVTSGYVTESESETIEETQSELRPTSLVQGKASSSDLDSLFGD
ncbi:MAG: hypothetical protein KME64_00365 [Scytonematopsis contorta HA4267-MV1]|nr:hypothetical protein [Scytonematopsis contorta HA4267-MV1]